ncbi:MAG: phosphomannomutase/phosphoglucomutase [Patescibacteria group bacterium]
MKVSPTIFRLYDIRGIAGKEFSKDAIAEFEKWYGPFPGINITLDVAEALGKAYGTYIQRKYNGKNIVVGQELRPFSNELTQGFINGILSTGCDVTDVGIALTPLVYFANGFYEFDGGVNVTGSHNVYFYNGFKMNGKGVLPIYGDELQVVREMVEKEDFIQAEKGELKKKEVYPDYENFMTKKLNIKRKLKVVIDCGNGSAGLFAPQFFRKLGCEVVELYTTPDATFPNHVPDPEMPNNMEELGRKVVETKADCGIGLDADGDRVGFVDENGEYVDTDMMILLLAREALKTDPGKKILYDVKCTRLMEELIPKFGGIPLMHITGHAPIKDTFRKDPDIIFGGEVSGHIYFVKELFRSEDGMYAGARILELLADSNEPFSALFKDFPVTVRTTELKLPCADEIKFDVIKKVQEHFSKLYKTVTIDGVRMSFDDKSWAIVRASNTSPYLTVRFEADTRERVLEMKNVVADFLEQFPEIEDKLDRKEVMSLTGRLGWV